MSKKSPEDLDKLFQQEPEQYPFGYNEASWKEMEELLDKDDRRRFLWWWFFGIGALLLIGSVLFFGKNETEVVDANFGFDKKEINQNQNSEKEIKQWKEVDSRGDELILNSNKIDSNSSKLTSSKQTNLSLNENVKNSQQYIYNNEKDDGEVKFNEVGFGKNKIENSVLTDSVFEKTNNSEDSFLLKKNQQKTEEKDSVNTLLQSKPIFPIASLKFFLSEKKEDYEIPFLRKKIQGVPVENENILLLGLIFGSESTATNRNDFSSPNWKIGGQVEYRFLQRFSTSIGANFVRKKYGAKGDDYNPENGGWLNGVAPNSVNASCDILEVPVTIGFFQKNNNQNGFYSKLGLTSIFMLEEHYWYFYDQEIPGQVKYWGGKNENQHWFGIGEISVGYQYYLSPKTSVQVEPFLQIPLVGIGNGKVKLWSVGLNMKFNFQVNKRLLESPLKK